MELIFIGVEKDLAKTFAQLIALIAITGAIIVILGMETEEQIIDLFKIGVPVMGGFMLLLALKSDFPTGLIRNKELAIVGLSSIILGATDLFGDSTVMGISVNAIGWIIIIVTELLLIFSVLAIWEWKK